MDNEGIAIIGMSGRFPGAENIEEYWQNIKEGRDCITFFTKEDASDAGVRKEDYTNENYVCAGGLLEDVEYFDEGFFGMTPREAADMDPQQRLFLECVYESLEDAGYAKDQYDKPVGVFAGANMSTYFLYHLANKIEVRDDFSLTIGNDKDYIATRASYIFNLKGPSMSVQTACSTSMTAVALACDSLESFQCDMAIAGGAAVKLPQKMGYLYQEGMIVSPDGHTRPFDEKGEGTVFSSAVGAVILKRLEDALRDGDHIYAVVKGIAVSNDGSDKVGFTALNREGQVNVIETAQYLADINPEDIGYVEAHATATQLGDPIVVSALTKAFGKSTGRHGYCAIGSVKGNIGHAVSGAGIASLIKTALVVKYGEIPPSIHFKSPNKEIDFINTPFYVNTRLRKWDSKGVLRTAGVSSFGFGGTNVHAVLQEADTSPALHRNASSGQARYLLTLSAKSEKVLDKMRERMAKFLRTHQDIPFEDIIFTLHVGRRNFEHRLSLVCKDSKEAMEMLFNVDSQYVFQGKVNKKEGLPVISKEVLTQAKNGLEEAMRSAGKLWVNGGFIDWESYHSGEKNLRVSLPMYPFDRKRHWVEQYSPKKAEAKRDEPIAARNEGNWLYKMNWERRDAVMAMGKEQLKDSKWLLFMDEIGLGNELCDYLLEAGARFYRVYTGLQFGEKDNGDYTINEHNLGDYENLMQLFLKEGTSNCYILHLWNVTKSKENLISLVDIRENMYKSFYSLLFLAQAIAKMNYGKKMRITVITNHMHLIAGEETVQPEKALVMGPLKVIPKENTNIFCQGIDLDVTEDTVQKKKQLPANICAEMMSVKPEIIMAYRGPFKWVQMSEPIRTEEAIQKNYHKAGAVYVIIGGFGGIGFELAKHLAGKEAVKLVLTGRRPADQQAFKIKQLEDLGADVRYLSADCTKEDEMENVFLDTMHKYGKIHGIFHMAGTIETEEIVNKTVEMTAKVLAPKVTGVLVLDKWITKCHPQFTVLFSSIGGILGTAGQIDYNSASSFLDAYAWHRMTQGGTRVIAINWDSWINPGISVSENNEKNRKSSWNISISEGMYLLDKIIDGEILPQAIATKRHFPTLLAEIKSFMRGEISDNRQQARREKPKADNRPELENPYIAPSNEIQKAIIGIWEELLGVHPVGLDDDYFDLGGHSLMATELIPKLNNLFEKKITLRELFEHSTVGKLALFYEEV